jgi:ribosomal protein S27AE
MSYERKKCPVCGHIGAIAEGKDMLRCGLCGVTDSAKQFKDMRGGLPPPAELNIEKPPTELLEPQWPHIDGSGHPVFVIPAVNVHAGDIEKIATGAAWAFPETAAGKGLFNVVLYVASAIMALPPLHPNLARGGLTGAVVGKDITREDVERLAACVGCTLVDKVAA